MKKCLLFYIPFLLFFLIFSYLFIDPNLFYLKTLYTGASGLHRKEVTTIYVLFILLFFFFYFWFLQLLQKGKIGIKEIIYIVMITTIVLAFSYPTMLSYDIFNYTTTAKVFFHYHENPYIVMPIEFVGEPFLQYTHAANKVALYGPLWIILSGIPYFLARSGFIFTLFSFKLFVLSFYFIACYFFWKLSKNPKAFSLFALNPLLIIETMISGHNDIVMMTLVLGAFYFLQNKKNALGIILFTLSIFIKYATVFLVPVFCYILWKHVKKEKIEWGKVYLAAFGSMLFIFLLAPLREEIYPWYAIWFLPFLYLYSHSKKTSILTAVFTISLLFRYIPFMATGDHFGITPYIKIGITFVPTCLIGIYLFVKKQLK